MLNVFIWIVAMLSPQPQPLTEMPANREGLLGRRIEMVVVKNEEEEERPSSRPSSRPSKKKRLFSRVVAKARSFNRTGKRKPLNF